jgi:hypothetical protein
VWDMDWIRSNPLVDFFPLLFSSIPLCLFDLVVISVRAHRSFKTVVSWFASPRILCEYVEESMKWRSSHNAMTWRTELIWLCNFAWWSILGLGVFRDRWNTPCILSKSQSDRVLIVESVEYTTSIQKHGPWMWTRDKSWRVKRRHWCH